MVWFAKCRGTRCEVRIRDNCMRYVAQASDMQPYIEPEVQGERCQKRMALPDRIDLASGTIFSEEAERRSDRVGLLVAVAAAVAFWVVVVTVWYCL